LLTCTGDSLRSFPGKIDVLPLKSTTEYTLDIRSAGAWSGTRNKAGASCPESGNSVRW
jgi:hypothetical protein